MMQAGELVTQEQSGSGHGKEEEMAEKLKTGHPIQGLGDQSGGRGSQATTFGTSDSLSFGKGAVAE
jgi:hypothetical protein